MDVSRVGVVIKDVAEPRIDTEQEKDKFLDDAMRLALDVSSNQTFNTVKPLLNFWAAFVPSHEVGDYTVLPTRLT